ncbi:MAG: hypothetical protein N2053_11175, partial [Chitinispirillaceae bacterium]|nr:hypothetical protein [Chitinispirillaceae bacterium]
PLADADSMLKILDSLIGKNWYIPALTKALELDTVMGVLLKNEAKAKEIRPKLIGTWKDVHVVKPPEDEEGGKKYKATDTRIFKFMKDGSFEGLEERHGQTTPYLKEDWKFLSWGKYDLMGDTIYIFINREKCAQQIFHQLNVKDNKWIKKEQPTYDSTFTTPRKDKDKFIVWSDLTLEFKKVK